METTLKIHVTMTMVLGLILLFAQNSLAQDNAAYSTSYNLTFKPLEEADLELMYTWVQRPFVKRWFAHIALPWDEFRAALQERLDAGIVWIFIVHTNEHPIGCIGYYDATQFPDGCGYIEAEGTYGIDLFIGNKSILVKDMARQCYVSS